MKYSISFFILFTLFLSSCETKPNENNAIVSKEHKIVLDKYSALQKDSIRRSTIPVYKKIKENTNKKIFKWETDYNLGSLKITYNKDNKPALIALSSYGEGTSSKEEYYLTSDGKVFYIFVDYLNCFEVTKEGSSYQYCKSEQTQYFIDTTGVAAMCLHKTQEAPMSQNLDSLIQITPETEIICENSYFNSLMEQFTKIKNLDTQQKVSEFYEEPQQNNPEKGHKN